MKPVYLLPALALLIPGSAFAQTSKWHFVGISGQGGETEAALLVDSGTIASPAPNIRDAWSANLFARIQDLGGGTRYGEMRIRYRFDCAANTFAIRDVSVWLDGRKLGETSAEGETKPVNPNSPAAGMAKAVCSGNFSALPPIQTASPDAERLRRFGN